MSMNYNGTNDEDGNFNERGRIIYIYLFSLVWLEASNKGIQTSWKRIYE